RIVGFTSFPPMVLSYAPCVGAVLDVRLGYHRSDPQGDWIDGDLYVRDLFPKHQEMVINEIIGTETLQKTSSSVTTTKSWNVSASGGITIPVVNLSLGASASSSETTVTQDTTERSQRDSRQTDVQNTNHVLTGYHQGHAGATLTIQPRPFEGENW